MEEDLLLDVTAGTHPPCAADHGHLITAAILPAQIHHLHFASSFFTTIF